MNVDYDFFKINSLLSPHKGSLIISEPFLPGDYFGRSTVLLVEYSVSGAVGFILNKPFVTGIRDMINDFPKVDFQVFIGGPVSTNNLFFIHTLGNLIEGSLKVKDELYWGGDFEQLKALISTGSVSPEQVRFFIGYSGWSAGQLDKEIEENSWLVNDIDIHVIMRSNKNFWNESVKNAGGHYKIWKDFPEDPNLN